MLQCQDAELSVKPNSQRPPETLGNRGSTTTERRTKLLGLDHPEKVETNSWNFDTGTIDAEVQKLMNIMTEREEAYFLRRNGEVRQKMRSQFEMEKRLEKEIASKQNIEFARASVLAMLNERNEPKETY